MIEAATERADPATTGLDLLATPELVRLLVEQHRRAQTALEAARPALALGVEAIVAALDSGGRLHYVGAGTSGRIGALDATELPPTFGIDRDRAVAHLAGGPAALLRAVEGAEDDADAGRRVGASVARGDAVVGISASGRAPFVLGAIDAAHAAGAATIGITSDPHSPLAAQVDVAIALATGAEALAGSTRMVAGTAAKMALGVLSTAAMVRLGRVYDNAMVDLVATNAKLRARALRLVERFSGVDAATAQALLELAGGNVKTAIVMARRRLDAEAAHAALAAAGGRLRAVVGDPPS